MKYIISPDAQMGYPVLTPEQINTYISQGYKYRERRYKQTTDHRDYEVICAEIWKEGEQEHTVVIPAFLVPHRPYPLEVYIYAANLYSGDPNVSQRVAAEATKKRFGLDTFSRSTISRIMKELSQTLEENGLAETSDASEEQMKKQEEVKNDDGDKAGHRGALTARDTKKRRESIKKFFKDRLDVNSRRGFMETCTRMAIWWHARFNRLLI